MSGKSILWSELEIYCVCYFYCQPGRGCFVLFCWVLISCYIFFFPFTSNLFMSLFLKYISYGHCTVGSCFYVQHDSVYHLIGIFISLPLDMTIVMARFQFIMLIFVFYLFCLFFIPFFSVFSFTTPPHVARCLVYIFLSSLFVFKCYCVLSCIQ